jgi:hypothetical protein
MIRSSARLAVLLTALFWVPAAWADTIADVVALVNQTSYSTYLNSLYTHNGNNRGVGGTHHDLARTYIYDTLADLGLTTTLDTSGGYTNVVAVKSGSVNPGNIYIIGGHYDSAYNPGADDDASGVAGVLEAARVLANYTFEDTVIFIAFDGEELGLNGSTNYANAHASDNILGMISLDMIAYNHTGANRARTYYYQSDCQSFAETLATTLQTYSGLTTSVGGQMGQSDHVRFDYLGKNAALLIEYAYGSNPNYHKSTDSVDTLNYIDYLYATSMTRGVVGYLALEAGLLSETVPEPSAMTLIGIGLIGVLLATRGRRKGRP